MKKPSSLRNTTLIARVSPAVVIFLFLLVVGTANPATEPGTITIVGSEEPVNLDPSDMRSILPAPMLARNILETLTEMNPVDSSITPKLATAWKQIDANTWQFSLRRGVKFHDGQDLNAEAIAFNVERLYEKRIKNFTRDHFFSAFQMQVRALDSHTVEFKTDRFEPLLPALFSNLGICSPKTPMDKWTRQPIGTGPYRFVRWDAGLQIVLERFDGYRGAQPQVKKAVYVWRKESAVRASMVLIGEADLTANISPQDANRPDMDFSYLNTETTFIRIGGAWDPPLDDRRVRMALNYAVDRAVIRGSILSKDVIPATHIYMPSVAGYNSDVKTWPYDPQKAKQLLDEARKDGVPVNREILLVGRIGYYPGGEELMEALLTMYKAVGFNVKLKMLEVGVFRPYDRRPYNPGLYLLQKQHDNSYGDAFFSLYHNYHCKGLNSVTCDKAVDDLIEKAQGATGEERKTLWQAAAKRIYEELIPNVVLFHMVAYARGGKRIDFKPALATAGEIRLSQITFKQ
jgi:peptide/nickel transport system substrate-binding protein